MVSYQCFFCQCQHHDGYSGCVGVSVKAICIYTCVALSITFKVKAVFIEKKSNIQVSHNHNHLLTQNDYLLKVDFSILSLLIVDIFLFSY